MSNTILPSLLSGTFCHSSAFCFVCAFPRSFFVFFCGKKCNLILSSSKNKKNEKQKFLNKKPKKIFLPSFSSCSISSSVSPSFVSSFFPYYLFLNFSFSSSFFCVFRLFFFFFSENKKFIRIYPSVHHIKRQNRCVEIFPFTPYAPPSALSKELKFKQENANEEKENEKKKGNEVTNILFKEDVDEEEREEKQKKLEKQKKEYRRYLNHKIWYSICKQDWDRWNDLFSLFKENGLPYDEVSYTLKLHGYILSHRYPSENAFLVLEEMERAAMHPIIIRLNKGLLHSYFELKEMFCEPPRCLWQNICKVVWQTSVSLLRERNRQIKRHLESLLPNEILLIDENGVRNLLIEDRNKNMIGCINRIGITNSQNNKVYNYSNLQLDENKNNDENYYENYDDNDDDNYTNEKNEKNILQEHRELNKNINKIKSNSYTNVNENNYYDITFKNNLSIKNNIKNDECNTNEYAIHNINNNRINNSEYVYTKNMHKNSFIKDDEYYNYEDKKKQNTYTHKHLDDENNFFNEIKQKQNIFANQNFQNKKPKIVDIDTNDQIFEECVEEIILKFDGI